MLPIVMPNPIQVEIVSAVPVWAGGAVRATMAENCGESPTTAKPHKSRNGKNTHDGAQKKTGDSTQHSVETANMPTATRGLPNRSDQ